MVRKKKYSLQVNSYNTKKKKKNKWLSCNKKGVPLGTTDSLERQRIDPVAQLTEHMFCEHEVV